MSVIGNFTINVANGFSVRAGNFQVGQAIANSFTRTATIPYGPSVTLPAAISGTLTTRTSDTAGVVTATNTLAGTETVAIFWTDPTTGLPKCAFGGSLSGVSGSSFTVTGLVGSVLPTASPPTVVTVAVAQSVTGLSIPGSSLQALSITSPQVGLAALYDSGPVMRLSEVVSPALPYFYPVNSGDTTPVAYTIVRVDCYGGSLYASSITVNAFA